MQELPHAWPFRQTLQHALAGSEIAGDCRVFSRGIVSSGIPAFRHPAAMASPSEQNHRSPFDTVMTVLSYQRPPGMW